MAVHKLLAAALLSIASTITLAAPVNYLTVDHSSPALIDAAGAAAVWKAEVPQATALRLSKLFPTSRYGFVSQVEGGFNDAKICVVTARVMLVPRSGKVLSFAPKQSAMAFDAQPNANPQQCKDLATAKLKEAVGAVVSGVVKK